MERFTIETEGRKLTVHAKETSDIKIEVPYTYRFYKMVLIEALSSL